MAITGTGTQADPFKPTTWEEFLSVSDTDSVYIELPEGAVFDMNDYYPEGIAETIPLRGFINGNGAIIKNAACYTADAAFRISLNDTLGQISNLNFQNIRYQPAGSDYRALFQTESTTFRGTAFKLCSFSGIIDNTGSSGNGYTSLFGIDAYGTVYRCSFNIKAIGNSAGTGTRSGVGIAMGMTLYNNWDAKLQYCNIKISGEEYWHGIYLDNTYLTGTGSSRISLLYGNESVIDCEASAITKAYGNQTKILINTDKYSGSIPSGCIGVTTEQLKDAEYLSSLGFPIQT